MDTGRRRFLKAVAASAAVAGSGCSKEPTETIVPYVDMPERRVPGEPVFYATSLVRNGDALGVLVKTDMGRPVKIEGNPHHPSSRGATDVFAQGELWRLWDPDRSNAVMNNGLVSTWEAFMGAMQSRMADGAQARGAGLRLLTGSIGSPTLLAQIERWQQRYPEARWHRHDPAGCPAAELAARDVFGTPARPCIQAEGAAVLLTLDADIFSHGPESVRIARDFMDRRRQGPRNHLYAVECAPGLSGAVADERLALRPDELDALVAQLGRELGLPASADDLPLDVHQAAWVRSVAKRLARHRGDSLIVGGPRLSRAAHAAVWRLNEHLGNLGRTVRVLARQGEPESLHDLVRDMEAGRVQQLFILDTNPVYDAAAGFNFDRVLRSVPFSVHMGLYQNETGQATTWHIPRVHDLEDWSDGRSDQGVAGIIQPVISPLYGGRSPHAFMAFLTGDMLRSAHGQVRAHWKRSWGEPEPALFEERWAEALRLGVVADMPAPRSLAPRQGSWPQLAVSPGSGLRAAFALDASVSAGEFANNAWLQELPRPLSKLTWDNAALLAPATAGDHGVVDGAMLRIRDPQSGRAIDAPALIQPGMAEGLIVLPLGYGRRSAGHIGTGVGFDAYALQGLDADGCPLPSLAVEIRRLGVRHAFARTQQEFDPQGREPVRTVTASFETREVARPAAQARQPSLYPDWDYPEYAWGMSIDLDTCIGCNACAIACQAENNIPVVGPDEVARGHWMHWLRIDLYREEDEGTTHFQPLACVHCENAPCELVCPVGATMHDSEGLNVQVYNRCVGTRFCSNNCPYKVRRFNFRKYEDTADPAARARQNPDVSVRQRGVMEKCTYCVQRISHARIEAQKDGRRIGDGDVVTACEAVCPTQAIVFGDLNDPDSRVSRSKAQARDYALLGELNTRPRTTYLARIVDPAAALEKDDV